MGMAAGERVEQMSIRYGGIDPTRMSDAATLMMRRPIVWGKGERQVFVIDPAEHGGQRQQNCR
ncbi:hypothetical protein XI08_19545 [Bradyrhizobium sp. CCBAU 11361]|nr:hypothetical protein [Bradyrhizobium sp. CCBAU 11361]